jgi:hypothetical protein
MLNFSVAVVETFRSAVRTLRTRAASHQARLLSVGAVLAGLACVAPPALQAESGLRTGQVRVVYAEPKEAKHQAIRDAMQDRRILELLQTLLNPIRLPRPLTLEVKGCDGTVDAYYGEGVATLCYEYVELIERHAPKLATPGGVTRADAVVGNILDTLLHEAGHAVIDMLELPVLGREEDAADFFSAYILLQFPAEDAQRLIQGVRFMMASEAREALEQRPRIETFAGVHGLPAQRYYNLLCMAYGSDPATFANLLAGGLPNGRAKGCGDEYALLKRSFIKLILPHVDGDMRREAFAQVRFNWNPLAADRDGFDALPLAD